jgi:lipoprotein-anchoring transpeptidase ErfK/SrfK
VTAAGVLALASALVLSGCGTGTLEMRAGSVAPGSSATIVITPAPTGKPVAPASRLVVTADLGRLTAVRVLGPDGVVVAGSLSVDGRTFVVAGGRLEYASSYTVEADAVDRAGLPTHTTTTLTTVAPSAFLGFTMSPRDGGTVGVGMPITLTLDQRLTTTAGKAAFERSLAVRADGEQVAGAWAWQSDNVVEYRPEAYWPGHATITVAARLNGRRITSSIWGASDRSLSFTTGAAMVSYIDIQKHTMRVTRDGKTIKRIPITTGKDGFTTRSGVKVISTKEPTRLMDASTGGTLVNDPEYYRLEVQWAMRLTNSGEFIHAAPWSVSHQGKENVSHGCTGMSTENAKWLYDRSRIGDVVVYTGSDRRMQSWNGIGLWNTPYDEWKTGSALS